MKHLTVLLVFCALAVVAIAACSPDDSEFHSERDMHHGENDFERGPNGGRLLEDGDFAVEVVIAEAGVPPEFHVYAYQGGEPVAASAFDTTIELERLGGIRDVFEFEPEGHYLRGLGVVYEPHSFDVTVSARAGAQQYEWQYDSYEGRTQIEPQVAFPHLPSNGKAISDLKK